MLLGNYFTNIDNSKKKIFFSGISFNTKNIKKDNIFFAIKGNHFDGNKFISTAIKKGSKIIISEKRIRNFQKDILFIHTKNIRKLLAETAFKIYKNKPNNLIAVTGTNGKSSVSDFYFQLLNLNKIKVASIGTLGVKSKNFRSNLPNTTIDPIRLGQILSKLKSQKINNVIMEASSHGLSQHRLNGLKFSSGIFTNLSQDHLDYHKNFKEYFKAKQYLFENLIGKKGNVITDETLPEFKRIKKIAITRKLKLHVLNNSKNQFQILSHSYRGEKQILKIRYYNLTREINLNLIGKIQLKNILMAIIAAKNSNIRLIKILNVLSQLKPIDGRLEKIGKIKNKSKVILDYAHTPDALRICLSNLKEQFPNKKIVLLFGCGGNRDQNKRFKMGKIACDYSNEIYLTDDNPRFEDPKKIRDDIKKGMQDALIKEIPDRKKAISEAIKNLNTGDILLVAGKGHEKTQDFGKKKIYFSDKKIILDSIKLKNTNLSKNLKINIIKEVSKIKNKISLTKLDKVRINSKEINKNDIFFAIKGKKNDGNKFIAEAFKNKASLVVGNKILSKFNNRHQIKVRDTLKFMTEISKIFRKNIDTNIIAITGSCGKTTLKELLGNVLRKISRVSISPKSYNNKFGVPLSLLNLKHSDEFGVLEVGMDKKGEIDNLTNIIKPNVGLITNINYAHAKNFKNIKQIALAKAEIIKNILPNGFVVLNADDSFFKLHKKIAENNNINVISFGIKTKKANVKLFNIKKVKNAFKIKVKLNDKFKYFIISNNFQSNIYNILSALSVISIYKDVLKLNEKIFLDFRSPAGRGDHSTIKIGNKKINLIDESYNSNPLSLKSALKNYDNIDTKKYRKYLLLGDMMELGSHSKKLHQSIVPIINETNIDKVFVMGKMVREIFDNIVKVKRGRILENKSGIFELIKKDFNNNDYLMIKASNATGFNSIANNLKGLN
ncbi:UDP-N-acetylmuramoyl-L-alanyl-D-glutamate--2,6-diaminopimelate ligase [Candidatus Pelagibacter sp. RS39]|uniref:UDP-N-acetylmuramoyl-L-alanyl-D-glutamate--2, 6-diaminopimelate ligase n=1 Tax=Candidatus Pelagibacter sp. RS39 TaxID=1977864 RepID=UPI000A15319C|nr:UDP-N-acetylmuramoyl-L-alanyl-D-glutamate--2,6-diaminopimelate ligase [Candidatus Pelagibacter sp. RS39]ARJ48229.1 UDP-N-acetylmuramoyl-L-alanyl-D-glutamate--2,6-diaminopimelate ligase [Candidatus Pelagibacter sp. RS39]